MDRTGEFPPLPEEYASPAEGARGGEEYIAPPEEYPRRPGLPSPAPSRRKRLKALLFTAAALLSGGALLFSAVPRQPAAETPPPAAAAPTAVPEPARTSEPAPEATHTPSPGPSPTPTASPTPTPTPTPSPTPTPAPTPEPEKPEAEAFFVSFSDTLEGEIIFRGGESILGAHVTVWDEAIGAALAEYDVPEEAIREGIFRLPTLGTGDLYYAHRKAYDKVNGFPDPELRLTFRYLDETLNEAENTLTVHNSYELGCSTRYYPSGSDDYGAVPDSFVFRTYESDIPVNVSYSRDDPAVPGAITVWLTIDGREVPAELVRDESGEENVDFLGSKYTYHYGVLVVPRPDWAGEHGTAVFTVRESLLGFDRVWVTVREIEY